MEATTLLNISAILLAFAACFGWLNTMYLRLPLTIGLMVIALLASLSVTGLDAAFDLGYAERAREALARIDFHDSLMIGMLHLLLFAGALHTDLDSLLQHKSGVSSSER
jgi:CPA1 family monovalent cation:H+ antiporter